MNRLSYTIIFLILNQIIFAQNLIHTSLSTTFNFKTEIKVIKEGGPAYDTYDSCVVIVTIINKLTKKNQKIKFSSEQLSKSAFTNSTAIRSYATGKNKNAEAMDWDYGDLIVADFNFDGKEDLAVKKLSGLNIYPTYNFYIQDSTGKFVRDNFLSRQMGYFPDEINKKKKTLSFSIPGFMRLLGRVTLKPDTHTNKWKRK